jgi:hypothetical protein
VPFSIGMVIALRLPAQVDSGVPEVLPRFFHLPGHRASLGLFDGHVWTAITASGALRALYGFLTLFFAFRTREDDLMLPPTAALAVIAAALGIGSLLSTVTGARIGLRHPVAVQLGVLSVVTLVCLAAAVGYSLPAAVALALVTAFGSGLAKLSVDAVIQERLPDETRASAFAHSETFLQLAWVIGGAIGLIPVTGRWGLLIVALGLALATTRVGALAWSLRVRATEARPVS